MELQHIFSLPLQANPCCLDPCANPYFLAVPMSKNVIGLWKTSEIQLTEINPLPKAIDLVGHSKEICAISFTSASKYYLASSCSEKVLLWDLNSLEHQPKHCQYFSNPGVLSVMCFNNNDSFIAAGKDSCVVLMEKGQSKFKATLEAHSALVSGIRFCPHYSATLISISDDRSFCVWNVDNLTLLFQSSILSSSPLISLNMNAYEPHVSIGSADGNLWIFDLTDGHDFRQIVKLNIANVVKKYHDKRNQGDSEQNSDSVFMNKKTNATQAASALEQAQGFVEASESLLSIEYIYASRSQDNESEFFPNVKGQYSGAVDLIREVPPSLKIISTNCVIDLNPRTLEIIGTSNLQCAIKSASFASSLVVGPVSYAVSRQINPFQVILVAGALFDRKIHILVCTSLSEKYQNLNINNFEESNTVAVDNMKTDDCLSVVAMESVLEDSPLKSEMLPPIVKSVTTKGDVATGKKKSLNPMNQPLTFKSKVKSSGYSKAPRTTMFKPETNKYKLLNMEDSSKKKTSKESMGTKKMLWSEYDQTLGPVNELCNTFEVDSSTTAVHSLRFSDDGNNLACALSNKTALAIKSPFSKHICTSFVGHNNQINSAYWSCNNNYILTASNDKTVTLWDKSGGDPLMILTHQKGTPKEKTEKQNLSSNVSTSKSKSFSSSLGSAENKTFSKEIKQAQFFYMDKFILTIHGNDLSLFKFYVTPETDDLKRYQSRNRYKLVERWQSSSSSFTSFVGVNNFFSHLVMCATTGKAIEVYDMNQSVRRHVFLDCHTRPPHCLAINEGSGFSSQPSLAYNVIASAAPTDSIKLWDLRSKSCIQALSGHRNNSHACQLAFSPCGNYLASGSEDRCVYLFDLRKGTFCEKLRGHTEVVCSVAFHPAFPLLATGSLNSKVIWYKSK